MVSQMSQTSGVYGTPYDYATWKNMQQNAISSTSTGYRPQSTALPGFANPQQAGGTAGAGNTAEKWLQDVLSGKNLPFNAQVQAQQLSQQSDMSAAAEGARNNQLDANAAVGGASGRDPSLQGAKAANFARRQTDNQTAARDISSNAATANFGAQARAATELSGNALQREAWANQAGIARMGMGSGAAQPKQQNNTGFLQWGGGSSQPFAQSYTYGNAYGTPTPYVPKPGANGNYSEYDG